MHLSVIHEPQCCSAFQHTCTFVLFCYFENIVIVPQFPTFDDPPRPVPVFSPGIVVLWVVVVLWCGGTRRRRRRITKKNDDDGDVLLE